MEKLRRKWSELMKGRKNKLKGVSRGACLGRLLRKFVSGLGLARLFNYPVPRINKLEWGQASLIASTTSTPILSSLLFRHFYRRCNIPIRMQPLQPQYLNTTLHVGP